MLFLFHMGRGSQVKVTENIITEIECNRFILVINIIFVT